MESEKEKEKGKERNKERELERERGSGIETKIMNERGRKVLKTEKTRTRERSVPYRWGISPGTEECSARKPVAETV